MPTIGLSAPRPAPVRGFACGLIAGSLLMYSGIAEAASPPESFSELAKAVTPAVVNIAASTAPGASPAPKLPFDLPEESPLHKFFEPFRDRMGEAPDGRAAPRRATGLGSGFIIDPAGYVVTNDHVVAGASGVTVRLDDDSVYPAEVVGTDPQTDLALLKIEADGPLPAVAFGDSDQAEVGDWIMAVGNPFGLGGTVTAGIVSARGRNINAGPYDDYLQIDAPINQGNSGGPLFDMEGKVIGVNTAIYSPNGGSVGIGFAIPSNIAGAVVAQLKEHGRVERGWLGVHIQTVSPEIADALGLDGPGGAMVTTVAPDSPAAEAGLRQGDVILGFDGQDVADPGDLARLVAATPGGSEAMMSVWRDAERIALTVVTGQQPARTAALEPAAGGGAFHSDALNADLAVLSPERRAEFEIAPEIEGVLVLDVRDGSVFEQGLRPGDVIREVAQTPVVDPSEVETLVLQARSEDSEAVLMLVSRQGQDLFLGLKLAIS